MRWIAVLMLGAVMYFGVPYLWTRAMVAQVNKVSSDPATFPEMNAAWDGWVSAGNTPARATVEAKLAAPQYNVEIMVVAAK